MTAFEYPASHVKYMKDILKDNSPYPIVENPNMKTRKDHVEHCLWQVIRFANLAKNGKNLRIAQLAYNLGRAQEILQGFTGILWKKYEPLIDTCSYQKIINMTSDMLKMLELEQPSVDFINQ